MNNQIELKFIKYHPDSYVSACLDIIHRGANRILLRPFNRFAADFLNKFPDSNNQAVFFVRKNECNSALPENVRLFKDDTSVDAVFFFIIESNELSSRLLEYLDFENGFIIAPITQHYYKNKPLFLISIPKSGTHLLYRLAEIFGYRPGIILKAPPSPGRWYCLEYSNSHTSAKDFFIDSVRRSPFGNRHHPFPISPTMFIYRNPLDILVSEANYYHRDGKTVFHGYLSNLSFEERLLTLIDDPWLLGSIRDRIGNFIAWLEFQNVIPVSFEELVGAKGGGTEKAQCMLIWSLQLKLHIPGNPKYFGKKVFDGDSPTFHKGRIGSFKKHFTREAYDKFNALSQDFMVQLGYDFDYQKEKNLIPKRAKEFRARSLVYSKADFDETPILVDSNCLRHSIVKYKSRYFGVPHFFGEFQLDDQPSFILTFLPSGSDLSDLKCKISTRRYLPIFIWKCLWLLLNGLYRHVRNPFQTKT